MIEIGINHIVKNYGYKQILNGAGFEIMTGDRAALIGRNGSGKSTLFRIIAGKETPDEGTCSIRKGAVIGYQEQMPEGLFMDKMTGEVLYSAFKELSELDKRLKKLESELELETDPDKLDRLMRQYGKVQTQFIAKDGYAMEEEYQRIITGFHLETLLELPFQSLSGGQKTIVMMAHTLLGKPDILLLDEPTNHLDADMIKWFEEFLCKYNGTVVLISHDRYFLDQVATKTVILDQGVCQTFAGNYTFSMKEQERLLLLEFEQYKNQQKQVAAMKAAIKRFRIWGEQADNPKFFKKAKELEHRLEKIELLDRPRLEKQKVPIVFEGDRSGKEVLRIEGFSVGFDNNILIQDLNLLIRKQEKVCLAGKNGSGKTTMIRCILGEHTDYTGSIKIGNSVKTGYIPQDVRFPSEKGTVLEVFRDGYTSTEGTARTILAKYFFTGSQVFKPVSALSGGERIMLKLAILIQNQINFLILDEPTNHIDIEMREVLEDALTEYDGTVLFISHDRFFVQKTADRIISIDRE